MKGFTAAIAVTAALAGAASAFTVVGPTAGRASTSLNLLPNQGRQLAAASSASLASSREKAAAAPTTNARISTPITIEEAPLLEMSFETPTEAAAARGLVAKLFSLPSILRGTAGAAATTEVGHPEMMADIPISFPYEKKDGDDVALYPIVGFRWVRTSDGGGRVLPPMECQAACQLPGPQAQGEEVYGWFSKACKLGSPFGEDDDYCMSPRP